jgi:hypothetical protein
MKSILILLIIKSNCLIIVFGAFIYPNVRRDDSIADNFFGTTVSKRAFNPLEAFNIFFISYRVIQMESKSMFVMLIKLIL